MSKFLKFKKELSAKFIQKDPVHPGLFFKKSKILYLNIVDFDLKTIKNTFSPSKLFSLQHYRIGHFSQHRMKDKTLPLGYRRAQVRLQLKKINLKYHF